ncbi:hypothetical protein MP477_11395 [Chryseobacterium sp. WG23]|uniref:hypothetical protein n=1 Tax=Chryseobacterium sp. WG23 TaxID=2926910 RepID=UPI00211EE77A|nr:hypothetical protein [Chryseobacterium sp. WG23]MCQ9635563.1 hypothetical protein [Chryseobacterium sp. WG23]
MKTESPFPSIESTINRLITLILNVTFFGLLLFFFVLFVLGPVYGIYKRGLETMFYPTLLCWGLSLPILIPVTWHYIVKSKKMACKIIVDQSGLLFYNSQDEIVDKILYTDLRTSEQDFDIRTVSTTNSGIIPWLEVIIQSEKTDQTTRRIDMNLPLFAVKNKQALYAHFLRGITVFRSDLKIDPIVFSTYSIDTKTWKINQKGSALTTWVFILLALICVGFICFMVFVYMKYNT